MDDGGPADASSFDAGRFDAGGFDAGRFDAGGFDAGRFDAGGFDAGRFDAGGFDAGRFDAGGFDAGRFDAGGFDAGIRDAGVRDLGTVDARMPPRLVCPDVLTSPLTPTRIAPGYTGDVTTSRFQWRIESTPSGSMPSPPAPATSLATTFVPDLAGEYRLLLVATEPDGLSASCSTRVTATSTDGLRIEMFWSTNGTDFDLHLLRAGAPGWFDLEDDCFFQTCQSLFGNSPDWGNPGPLDDPSLDIDNTSGAGPENINITRPAPGVYRVGVHVFSGFGSATVRVYCGGSSITPRATFGPVALRDNWLWRVADVTIGVGGSCSITDLRNSDGSPNLVSETASRSMP